tara:strand:- start:864 stop:1496 length:633 start_codon:yes stop_codon:yes gene_type:complete
MSFLLVGSAAVGLTGALVKGSKARKEKRSGEKDRRRAQERINELEAARVEIPDLAANLSNPFNNLGVATQAAEIQMEQTDIALANTLDTIRATGGGAGGATALAQAALQSKKGVAASIEGQEAANQKLAAQGEQNLQAQRAAAEEFSYREQDKRDLRQLDRAQVDYDAAQGRKAMAEAAGNEATSDIFGAISGGLTGASTGGLDFKAFSK